MEVRICPLIKGPCPLDTNKCVAFTGRRCSFFNLNAEDLVARKYPIRVEEEEKPRVPKPPPPAGKIKERSKRKSGSSRHSNK